jgi:hypothetical protein
MEPWLLVLLAFLIGCLIGAGGMALYGMVDRPHWWHRY